jgi:hypothetical protein
MPVEVILELSCNSTLEDDVVTWFRVLATQLTDVIVQNMFPV